MSDPKIVSVGIVEGQVTPEVVSNVGLVEVLSPVRPVDERNEEKIDINELRQYQLLPYDYSSGDAVYTSLSNIIKYMSNEDGKENISFTTITEELEKFLNFTTWGMREIDWTTENNNSAKRTLSKIQTRAMEPYLIVRFADCFLSEQEYPNVIKVSENEIARTFACLLIKFMNGDITVESIIKTLLEDCNMAVDGNMMNATTTCVNDFMRYYEIIIQFMRIVKL